MSCRSCAQSIGRQEIAGAAGILIGLWLEPLGTAAAIGLVAYFVGALIGHPPVGDTKGATAPVVPLVPSIAVLVPPTPHRLCVADRSGTRAIA
ncbi:DoxX family protein [Geodermatophilus sp. SYSU D00779]